jgi:streptogramin lyase
MAKVDLRVVISLIVAAAMTGCAGAGNGPSLPPPNSNAAGSGGGISASQDAFRGSKGRQRRIALDKTGQAITLPPTSAMTERITLPANNAPAGASLDVTVSKALPFNAPRIPARKSQAFMAFTLEATTDVTLDGVPKFSVRLHSKPANNGAMYAWAYSPQNGWREFGPISVSGNVVTFGGSRKHVKLERGVVYDVIPFTAAPTQGCPTSQVLFVANNHNGTVTEFAPPYTGAPIATLPVGGGPSFIAFDPSGNLWVSNSAFAPPYTGAPIITIPIGGNDPIFGVVFDPSSDVFLANLFASNVTEWAPPYPPSAPVAAISNGINGPLGLTFDHSGNLFVANFSGNTVTEYAPPFNNAAPIATITNGVAAPFGLAFNSSGDLFVANFLGGTVTAYAPPFTGTPITTISKGLDEQSGVAFDANDNLFVSNQANSTITEYVPPYTGSPVATLSNPANADPVGLLFGP